MAHHIHKMLRQPPGDIERRGRRPGRAHEMDDLLAGAQHHAEHGEFGQGTAEIPDVLTQFTAVERPRHHRAAALRAAGGFGVIIRKSQRHVELDRGLTGEEIDRFGTRGEESVDAGGVETVAGLMAQIGPRLIGALDDAPIARQRRSGNREPAAGARGGAAKARLLLDDQDVETAMPRGDGRRHAGRARAHHQRIALVVFWFDVRHAIRPACSEAAIWKGMDFPVNRASDGTTPRARLYRGDAVGADDPLDLSSLGLKTQIIGAQ